MWPSIHFYSSHPSIPLRSPDTHLDNSSLTVYPHLPWLPLSNRMDYSSSFPFEIIFFCNTLTLGVVSESVLTLQRVIIVGVSSVTATEVGNFQIKTFVESVHTR